MCSLVFIPSSHLYLEAGESLDSLDFTGGLSKFSPKMLLQPICLMFVYKMETTSLGILYWSGVVVVVVVVCFSVRVLCMGIFPGLSESSVPLFPLPAPPPLPMSTWCIKMLRVWCFTGVQDSSYVGRCKIPHRKHLHAVKGTMASKLVFLQCLIKRCKRWKELTESCCILLVLLSKSGISSEILVLKPQFQKSGLLDRVKPWHNKGTG